ncbi:MAG: right-handed parallel beta-helix repeat-containing protein [Phycisphaerales bacterium]|nr:MAG: right-handed parallel beta-helix repeat-containing protein [Phycisphaerales bacterium]
MSTIHSATAWEVRTTGAADNGGGFNAERAGAGTDYSQQDAPQLSLADLCCDGEPWVTSETGGFTAAMVGNVAYITGSGAVDGFYEIVSFVSGNEVHLNHPPGMFVNAQMKVGGAQSDLGRVLAAARADASYGNVIHVRQGTYVLTTGLETGNDGHYLHPIVVRGYGSTRGDAVVPCVVIDGNDGDYNVVAITRTFWRFEYIEVWGRDPSAGAPTYAKHGFGIGNTSAGAELWRCRVRNVGKQGIWTAGPNTLIAGCEVSGWGQVQSGTGIRLLSSASGSLVVACNVHDSNQDRANDGYYTACDCPAGFDYCLACNCTGKGFVIDGDGVGGRQHFRHCVACGGGEDGFYLGEGTGAEDHSLVLQNCLAVGNAGHGVSAHAAYKGRVILLGAGFQGNTSGEIEGTMTVEERVARVSLSADPFVDAAAGDFRLKAAATQCLGTGVPGAFLSGGQLTSWSGHPDLGAVHQPVRPVSNPFAAAGV